jgi:hypothetical protein
VIVPAGPPPRRPAASVGPPRRPRVVEVVDLDPPESNDCVCVGGRARPAQQRTCALRARRGTKRTAAAKPRSEPTPKRKVGVQHQERETSSESAKARARAKGKSRKVESKKKERSKPNQGKRKEQPQPRSREKKKRKVAEPRHQTPRVVPTPPSVEAPTAAARDQMTLGDPDPELHYSGDQPSVWPSTAAAAAAAPPPQWEVHIPMQPLISSHEHSVWLGEDDIDRTTCTLPSLFIEL